jgi:hypothetical protein
MFKDAKVFHNLGFAIHLLRSGSKVPIESKWSTSPRKSWDEIKKNYKPGHNLGVVLGLKSKIKDTYLAVIDCDVKGNDVKYEKELQEKLKEIINVSAPTVLSGRGNGSRHIYFRTHEPVKPFSFFKSKEKVKVHMPSVPPSGNDQKALSEEELKKGFRVRPAWEISIMGSGQQVVLPPSIHPDTKKPYKWQKEISDIEDIPVIDLTKFYKEKKVVTDKSEVTLDPNSNYIKVDALPLSDKFKAMIKTGEGVDDRSASLYSVALHALHQGVDVKTLLNVLTNPSYYLGMTGYDHAKTKNRSRASEWVYNHTVKKAESEISCEDLFNEEVEMIKLPPEEVEKQTRDMKSDKADIGNWTDMLHRNRSDGAPKVNHFNIKLILKHASKKTDKIAARNLFSFDDNWLGAMPWGSKKGGLVTDDDIIRIKDFLAHKYRLDAGRDKINDALSAIALENAYHPVREYLENLKWDGVERLGTWLQTYLGAVGDKDVLDCFGSRTLIGLVRRIYEPGCKFDTVLILEGVQDIGKSTTARIIAGEEWFSDSDINIGDKDAVVSMNGNWVIELAELAALSKRDSESLKQFITRQVDKIRPHYGKRLVAYPRQSIFFGSTNNDEYLKDNTGNRRYWPVKVTEVDFDSLRRDRDQLLAEAKEAYFLGFPSYLDPRAEPDLYVKVQREQAKRMVHDELESAITDLFNKPEDTENDMGLNPNYFRMSDLFNIANFTGTRFDTSGQMRVGAILKKLGYLKLDSSFKGGKGKYWVNVKWAKKHRPSLLSFKHLEVEEKGGGTAEEVEE